MTKFLHFVLNAVYFMPYNVNGIDPFLQVFRHSQVKPRTFHAFSHDTPGLLRLMDGVELGAGLVMAGKCGLNIAKPGTLSPRGCCGVL